MDKVLVPGLNVEEIFPKAMILLVCLKLLSEEIILGIAYSIVFDKDSHVLDSFGLDRKVGLMGIYFISFVAFFVSNHPRKLMCIG